MMNTSTDYRGTSSQGNDAYEQREGGVARTIEQHTAKIPSDVFLWGATAAMVGALAFQIFGPKQKPSLFGMSAGGRAPLATFVGQWVPTLLLFGIYNKIVKVAGSDRVSE